MKSGDKFANYSTASQLGLVDDETPQPTTFEIEQMLKNKETKVGQWEAVAEPTGLYSGSSGIRNEHAADGEEETEGWKFQHKGKRPVRDPYDDDDFDPSAILKMRKKVKQNGEEMPAPAPVPVEIPTAEELDKKDGALDRDKWSGKIEFTNGDTSETGGEGANMQSSPKKKDGLTFQSGGGWVKLDSGALANASVSQTLVGTDNSANMFGVATTEEDSKPTLPEPVEEKPVVEKEAEATPTAVAVGGEASSSGLFKKRRPPPSSRKK
jgi:WW domain-binding protein 4